MGDLGGSAALFTMVTAMFGGLLLRECCHRIELDVVFLSWQQKRAISFCDTISSIFLSFERIFLEDGKAKKGKQDEKKRVNGCLFSLAGRAAFTTSALLLT